GDGPASDQVTATPAAVPDQPSLSATPGNQQVELSWTAPADNGSLITDYTVTVSPPDGTCTPVATSCTVDGLNNGTGYTFTVTATNADGDGPASDQVTATPAAVPDKPTGLSATSGDGQVELSWTAPADNGSSITDYTVTVSPPHGNCTPVVTSCTVVGLANGTEYTFTVTATNGVGDGP
ncbi:MAG: fibronectin type III domain-containing protein, partial [Acidimicrobiales bacterium]|nr:fibronectin type III domain-containing protein [Acidimicrobiales bacterium]